MLEILMLLFKKQEVCVVGRVGEKGRYFLSDIFPRLGQRFVSNTRQKQNKQNLL